jgi:hypothetical protein
VTAPAYQFPDIEAALTGLLEPFVPTAEHVGTETPATLTQMLPFVRVMRHGGYSDRLSDHAYIDIDVYAPHRGDGVALAEAIRQYLTGPPPHIGRVVIDRIDNMAAPQELPWGDRGVRRFAATYLVVARRHTTS